MWTGGWSAADREQLKEREGGARRLPAIRVMFVNKTLWSGFCGIHVWYFWFSVFVQTGVDGRVVRCERRPANRAGEECRGSGQRQTHGAGFPAIFLTEPTAETDVEHDEREVEPNPLAPTPTAEPEPEVEVEANPP